MTHRGYTHGVLSTGNLDIPARATRPLATKSSLLTVLSCSSHYLILQMHCIDRSETSVMGIQRVRPAIIIKAIQLHCVILYAS